MEIRWYPCDLEDFPSLELYILSDVHDGNPYSDTRRWLRTLEYIGGTPNAFAILNGDLLESATRASISDVYGQIGTPGEQKKRMIEWLHPHRKKILGMTTGNHERRLWKEVGVDLSEEIAASIGCPYDPDGIWLRISFGSGAFGIKDRQWGYTVYATHGYGGARTKGAKAVKVERTAKDIEADIYAMSHDHDVDVSNLVYLKRNPRVFSKDGQRYGVSEAHKKKLVKTNAYLKWGGYGRSGGYSPVDLDTPQILLRGKEVPWTGPEPNDCKPRFKVVS